MRLKNVLNKNGNRSSGAKLKLLLVERKVISLKTSTSGNKVCLEAKKNCPYPTVEILNMDVWEHHISQYRYLLNSPLIRDSANSLG